MITYNSAWLPETGKKKLGYFTCLCMCASVWRENKKSLRGNVV